MAKAKSSKKYRYQRSLILFSLLLFILSIFFLVYVFNSMVLYERNLEDNYIKYLATSGKLSKKINNDSFKVSDLEKKNAKITDGVNKIFKNKELKIKKNSKESSSNSFVYDLIVKEKLISKVTLISKKSYKRMAILTINEWDVKDIKTYFDNGIYNYEINIPANYKLLVNNKEVDSSYVKSEGDVEGLERITTYVEISKNKVYVIDNLVNEPTIKILDENNKNVSYEIKDNKINIGLKFKEIESLEQAKEYIKDNFDIMKTAEIYSLYLTQDASLSSISKYLIKDSYMYTLVKNTDTHFTSRHSLKSPVFTNEYIKNFIIYGDNAFSCEVHLEKNMRVLGQDRVDTMHDRLYFVYYDNGYKLVDMKSID